MAKVLQSPLSICLCQMSTSTVFNITQKWRNGADIFSELSEEQVKVLLEALVSGTKLDKDSVSNERLLTVSDWIQHVVEKAGAQQLKLERLKKELEEYMDDQHQEMLLRYYQHFVQKLRTESDRSPVSPLHLNNVQWRVQFQLGQGDFNKVLEPTALVHFDVSPPEKQDKVRWTIRCIFLLPCLSSNPFPASLQSKDSFTLEFDRESLFRFYMQLEDLQEQLDDLG